jgi:hypothetical protein
MLIIYIEIIFNLVISCRNYFIVYMCCGSGVYFAGVGFSLVMCVAVLCQNGVNGRAGRQAGTSSSFGNPGPNLFVVFLIIPHQS